MSSDRDPVTEVETPDLGPDGDTADAGVTETAPAKDTADAGDRTKPEDVTDPWEKFAPATAPPPGRVGRAVRRAGRVLAHEWTVASLLGVLLAVVLTWPSALHPADTLPEDLGDPSLIAWIVSWSGHALTHDPTNLWHSNTFFPDRYSFAYTDSLLGYAPVGLIGSGFAAAVIRYNVLFILAFALASVGAYALVRQLGAGRIGAALAGVAYAYAPWRYSQTGHLHVLSSGGIVLALAMLARGHGLSLREGYRRERTRPGWALAGWLVAAWQITIGFGIGVVFGYVLAGCVLVGAVAWLLRRWRLPRRLVLFDLAGGLVFLGVTAVMAYPYLRVVKFYPDARRTAADVAMFSPPVHGLLVAPRDSLLWGSLHADVRESLSFSPEMTLLPGFALLGLAIAGLFFSAWSLRARLLLALGAALTMVCALGTRGPWGGKVGYLALFQLPGFDALRTPGRLIAWTILLLGIIAAGALTAFTHRGDEMRGDRVPGRPEAVLRIAALLPLALVLAEGVNTVPHPVVPRPPAGFAQLKGPMLMLPEEELNDDVFMLWSTNGFPTMVNGNSGYLPPRGRELRRAGERFPDPASIDELRAAGVRTVVVLRDQVDPAQYDVPVDELGMSREEKGNLLIFTLDR
jgi:hypothetical protein